MGNEFFYIYEIDEDNNWSVCTWDEKSDCYDPQVTVASDDTIGMEELEDFLNKLWEERDEWISVEDRLPKSSILVLMICDGTYTLGALNKKEMQWYACDLATQQLALITATDKVTHWQPLPKPPKFAEQKQECTCFLRTITTGHEWKYCPKCGREL